MTSLSFPDVNVWLAILIGDHVHRQAAEEWWETTDSSEIAFTRITQLSVLRLLTTVPVQQLQALSVRAAWKAYDSLFADDRVVLREEPLGIEARFRALCSREQVSPKLWADAYLLAFAESAGGRVVTFDKALATRSRRTELLG